MRNVKINKNELLKIVRENRDKHAAAYDVMVEDYKAGMLKMAKNNLAIAKSGDLTKFKEIQMFIQSPEHHLDNYDRSIRMLELSVEEVIDLQQEEFSNLVLDEWSWKRAFAATGMAYKSI